MAIEKEAVVILLRQVLMAKPQLRQQIKTSREVLFAIIARIYSLDEVSREIAFEREEIQELFDALLAPQFAELSNERLQRFFEQIMTSAEKLVQDDEFRKIVALALLEAAKARLD